MIKIQSRVHVLITGRVQGVWFRSNTKQKADKLGITGWVRNTTDGNVEAVFEGFDKRIEEMIDWCKTGPPLAKVENVKIEKQDPKNNYDKFSIKN